MGHWHEIKYGETIHCYQISDSIVSVDKFTFGYSRKVVDNDIYQSKMTNSTYNLLHNYPNNTDRIDIGDSILWLKMPNNNETFKTDLAVGLLLRVHPPESLENVNVYRDDSKAAKIYIGQLKDSPHDRLLSNQYNIQLNDSIASANDIEKFLHSHYNHTKDRMVIIHADRHTSNGLMNAVIEKINRAGYSYQNIYRTVIDSDQYKMGLVRCR